MDEQIERKKIKIAITDPSASPNSVSVDILVRTLEGFQKIVHALGASKENFVPKTRIRYPSDLKKRYTFVCGIPEPGSFLVGGMIEDYNEQLVIQSIDINQDIYNYLDGIRKGDHKEIERIIPNHVLRNHIFWESEKLLPKSGEQWGIEFEIGDSPSIHLDSKNQKVIRKMRQPENDEESLMTVTGLLIKVDFEEHKVIIKHPVTNREIKCTYDLEIEDTILSSKLDYIQVTGTVILDDEGNPKSLSDVGRIEPVDLSDITISEVDNKDYKLIISPPITIKPKLDDDSKQLYIAIYESLTINLYAYTREDLVELIRNECIILWEEFALADSDSLTEDAVELKEKLQERFKEAQND